MPSIHVDLGDRSYPIGIEAGIFNNAGFFMHLVRGKQAIIVSNEVVAPLFMADLEAMLISHGKEVSTIVLPDGEAHKSLANFDKIQSTLLEKRISRDACIFALGGGVIGDLTGFAAACFQRGVDFIQIPTTLLSQVDSSVGGKTAINHPLGKNMIGAFYQPKAVIIDPNSLDSLPSKEFSAGMAEVIKYGIIYDKEFFDWLETNKTSIKAKQADLMAKMIARCCEIKAEIVRQDEKEQGLRALLNLGHTFGHAIEAEMGYGEWLHGEAVAAGTMLACQLANMREQMTADEVNKVKDLFAYFDLPTEGPSSMNASQYISHMQRDKKAVSGSMRFIVPIGIGKAELVGDVSTNELHTLIN